MKHLFVTYEIAKLLNEKGFNEPCLAYFETENTLNFMDTEYGSITPTTKEGLKIDAPLPQQAIEWLDLRGIAIMHYFNTNCMKWQYIIVEKHNKGLSDNYYDVNEAIKYAIELINI